MLRIVFVIIIALPSLACADLYQWIDENGVKHYANSPPPANTGSVRQMEEVAGDPDRPDDILQRTIDLFDAGDADNAMPARPKPTSVPRVVMYTTPTCGFCHRAKAYFDQRGIPFTERDISRSSQARRQFKMLNGRGVPLIVIGDQRIAGFNQAAIDRALGLP